MPVKTTKAKPAPAVWKEGRIRVVYHNPTEEKVVMAKVFGFFAVRQVTKGSTKVWTLTHVPSGLKVVDTEGEADCRRVGEYLQSRFEMVFSKKLPTYADLPDWFKPWILSVNGAGKWVEPPE